MCSAQRIENPALAANFEQYALELRKQLGKNDLETIRGFHGTRPENLEGIAWKGLLKVGHPLNPSKAVDGGFFGDPHQGVYLSKCISFLICNYVF